MSLVRNIPEYRLNGFVAAITKLNAKAAKLGVKPVTFTVGAEQTIKMGVGSDAYYEVFLPITVEGEAPVLNGWSFISKIENQDGQTIVRTIPGVTLPEAYWNVNQERCEHCNINRPRNNTFIVKHTSGVYKQVGSSCLKDFLDHSSPEKVLNHFAEFITLVDSFGDVSGEERGPTAKSRFSIESVIAVAIASIEKFGYRKTDQLASTKDSVITHFLTRKPEDKFEVTKEQAEKAPRVVEWMKGLPDTSEFNHNLRSFANMQAVRLNSFGFISAAAMMFLKNEGQKAVSAVQFNDQPIANIGAKVKVVASVLNAHRYERASYSYYDSGVSQILTMKTADNKLIKMFTSNLNIKNGDTVVISGAIKSFEKDTYRGATFDQMVTMFAPRTRIALQ